MAFKWKVIKSYLPRVRFLTVHYAYFIGMSLVTSAIFWGSSTPAHSVRYIDSLFLTISAMTLAGLNTVNLSTLNTFQQILLFFLIMAGSTVKTPPFFNQATAWLTVGTQKLILYRSGSRLELSQSANDSSRRGSKRSCRKKLSGGRGSAKRLVLPVELPGRDLYRGNQQFRRIQTHRLIDGGLPSSLSGLSGHATRARARFQLIRLMTDHLTSKRKTFIP